ncbi:MAG: biopolymer transporter ExbD [Thiohalophilus sp.]|jgi:biopolymer transport protein ExbD
MPRKHHYRRREGGPPELDVTTFLNLMVVLVPFLLITAVFSRITIHELSMPASAGADQANKPKVTIEVIVRKNALEVGDGRRTIARFRNKEDNKYDLKKLSDYLLKVKGSYPDKTDAVILMEPDIEYDYLVQVMDAVRVREKKPKGEIVEENQDRETESEKIVLFPDISIGDAP